ncbi:Protein BIG GRAIN 1-like [Zea mays]|jgi:hypothetical protein|uniref:Protein BIG GRAIN 1-like n=2 Tax=Zea mays TaxID=4577 RepID=A0A1D6GR19_MAIZE|nr:protein BIG GRAIN 1-like [Zea mays]AQK65560.1 hypothetical protein ZEAMMB73_Zm00001d014226 [Zea mays]PWZ20460.1 Protein BIG GRAIN 1-like [Zea mays]|eukprot:XP_008644863.1 protein BIG GRAIN 1-like [Zea mays]
MERWAPAPPSAARERPRRRPGQPSFSSTLLDAICDSLDEQAGGHGATAERATAPTPRSAKEQHQAALHYYYYKPFLAASHRAARAAPSPADDCSSGRGYFSSSEVEYSLRRLRPIRTSAGGVGPASVAPVEKQKPAPPGTAKRARKPSAAPASGGCRRPASPGARLASLLNAIFSGKRNSARQHPAPADEEPACSTAPSTARPCLAKTPPSARARARATRNRSRTVRFLDIEGEVAVAAAAAGCRRFPVVEVEDSDGGEESSDASSDLFELENLAALAPANGGPGCRRTCENELPVYGTTGAGLGNDSRLVRRRRPFGYVSHGRSCRGLFDFK